MAIETATGSFFTYGTRGWANGVNMQGGANAHLFSLCYVYDVRIGAFCNNCFHIKNSLFNFRSVLMARPVILLTRRSDKPDESNSISSPYSIK